MRHPRVAGSTRLLIKSVPPTSTGSLSCSNSLIRSCLQPWERSRHAQQRRLRCALGPVFAMNGWVFFGPYRRGQGLSASVGKYIGDEIAAATKTGGLASGSAKMVRLLETDHLNDQVAALTWLRTQKFVEADRTAVAGNSFGGIEAELGASTPTTIVDDAQCSQFPRANFFLSGRE